MVNQLLRRRRHFRELFIACGAIAALPFVANGAASAAGAGSVTSCSPVGHLAPSVKFGAAKWTVCAGGTITQSSPAVAEWNGTTVVAIGDEHGYVHLLNATTGAELPGWPQRMAAPARTPVAIEGSPTIAFLDGKARPPSVIVGSASTWVTNRVGEVEAFKFDGSTRFVFHVGASAGTDVGVIGSPAVGDVVGNGQQQIVFGVWDHKIYVLSANGQQIGFAYDNADTIWSSPALLKRPGQPGEDIIIGSDASGRPTPGIPGGQCTGGFVGDYRFTPAATDPDTLKVGPGLERIWFNCLNQSVWSSPSIATIAGRPVVFVGTSFFEQPFPSATDHLYAFYADSGATVPGWPVKTPGPVLGSAAVGALSPGKDGVVVTSFICNGANESSCFGSNRSEVLAWTTSGSSLWKQALLGPTALGSPVLVPLAGESTNDVLVSTPNGMYPLSGSSGAPLFGTNLSNQFAAINPGCRSFSTPAVADVFNGGIETGWMAFESCGGPPSFHAAGEVAGFALPDPPISVPAWPMFHGGATHTGNSTRTITGT